MSDELSAVEKSVEEVLIDMMAERVMSTRVQDSSMRSASLSVDFSWIWTIPIDNREENQAQR
jgi:hypothetical protein